MADAGADSSFIAFQVGDQSGKLHSRESVELGGYGFRICQLRHPFRMDKTGGLNVRDTSDNELLDQGELVFRWNWIGLVLEPIARRDVDHVNFVFHRITPLPIEKTNGPLSN